MREIEIKVKAKNLESIKKEFFKRGLSIPESKIQIDTIFIEQRFESVKEVNDAGNGKVLRIRETSGEKPQITLKVHQSDELDCLEETISLEDEYYEGMYGFVTLLGYKEVIKVKKKRTEITHGAFSFCVDEVEGLGSFVEIEYLTSEDEVGSITQMREKLISKLEEFNIAHDEVITKGYDTLLEESLWKAD